ncbi:MAG: prolyl oligopeptidase family serine peptidase, partial [Clostridia bacterium]|nr:prolyl oligopeptidase family serine peptidase [Clostridia bacterium]
RADITGAADYAELTDEKWNASSPVNGTGFFDAVTGENIAMSISDYMSWAVAVGIVVTDEAGRLDPYEELTHAELEAMIERYLKLKKNYDLKDTLKLTYEASSGQVIPYRLYVPEDYDEGEKYPVVLYLHGLGYVGSGNEAQLSECANVFANPNSPVFESIFIIPQCPKDSTWNHPAVLDAVSELVEYVNRTYSTDRSRQYVTGVSLGGMGTWAMVRFHPEQFSAAIPVASPVAFSISRNGEEDYDITVLDPSWYDEEYVKENEREFRVSPEMFEIPIRNVYDADDELLGDMKEYFEVVETIMNRYGAVDYENVRTVGYGHGGICHQYVDRFDYSLMEWMFSQRRETGIKP